MLVLADCVPGCDGSRLCMVYLVVMVWQFLVIICGVALRT